MGEAEVGGLWFLGQPRAKILRPYLKNKLKAKRAGIMALVVEH
jgi:hypothetical protein